LSRAIKKMYRTVHLGLCKITPKIVVVQHVGKSLHLISDEIARWREILAVPYQDDLLSR